MKFCKKISFIFIILIIFQTNLSADVPYYLDFKYVLNQSDAGKKAQAHFKKKLDNGAKMLQKKEKALQEEEIKIIQQKIILLQLDLLLFLLILLKQYKFSVNLFEGHQKYPSRK